METIKKDGSTVAKQVRVLLDTPNPKVTATENPRQVPSFDEPVDTSGNGTYSTYRYYDSIDQTTNDFRNSTGIFASIL